MIEEFISAKINRLGIDLHGVLDHNPEDKKKMLKSLMEKTDMKIYIISGPPTDKIIEELHNLGFAEDIHYHMVFSVVDFLKNTNIKMWLDEKDRWWTDYEDWWSCKAKICEIEKIDLMIDDSEKYGPYFKNIFYNICTKFLLYNK